ncbi:Virginiamycin B lyase [Paraglaciecola mesophila]|uniref:Virginiamycin B lyase n=1 Tax=Paraglaciecola mesophila TaxID=197222 RepID=A0A857JJ95_9ALTE|nr:cytochrome C [Paraglaciecola mesophila]QHJ11037.1 Virginiamycin B lyase [Paraglaciecola mesophila]
MKHIASSALHLAATCLSSTVLFAQPLPESEEKQLVEAHCNTCHASNRISSSLGYSQPDWQALIATMVNLDGNPNREKITAYLAEHFPPSTRRSPQLPQGDIRVNFKEWVVPTLGQRARDPIEAPDGRIWWAGQWGNIIGRIDPQTGEMREYSLPAGAKPHSVTHDSQGNIWYTGNKNGTVGMLNPETGKITEYKMPAPNAKDPHTAIFDSKGILWFTLQHSNMIGRLNPQTEEIKLVTMPTEDARPYGIKIDKNGTPWVACNGSNCLVKVEPNSMTLREYPLPNKNTTVRRLDIADDGMIWYVNSGQGRLGRFNPQTGEVKEWPSPSGANSHPYAIAVIGDAVWYNESGMRPDALVRFDRKTEAFQSWPIPTGAGNKQIYAGIVRHMRPTRDGNLLIHQSATNRIILVKPEGEKK